MGSEMCIRDRDNPSALDEIADCARALVLESELVPNDPDFKVPGGILIRQNKWKKHHLVKKEDIEHEVDSTEWWKSVSIFCGNKCSPETHTAIIGPKWPRDMVKCQQCWRFHAPYRTGGSKFKG